MDGKKEPGDLRLLLSVRDLILWQPPDRMLVHDGNLTLYEGEHVYIRGSEGAGRRQLFRVLAGRANAQGGVILRPGGRPAVLTERSPFFPELAGRDNLEILMEDRRLCLKVEEGFRELTGHAMNCRAIAEWPPLEECLLRVLLAEEEAASWILAEHFTRCLTGEEERRLWKLLKTSGSKKTTWLHLGENPCDGEPVTKSYVIDERWE